MSAMTGDGGPAAQVHTLDQRTQIAMGSASEVRPLQKSSAAAVICLCGLSVGAQPPAGSLKQRV